MEADRARLEEPGSVPRAAEAGLSSPQRELACAGRFLIRENRSALRISITELIQNHVFVPFDQLDEGIVGKVHANGLALAQLR